MWDDNKMMVQTKETVELQEYEEQRVINQFTIQELHILRSEFDGKVDVILSQSGEHSLKAYEFVGTIVLPHHIIRIRPKILDVNFMFMITTSLKLPEIKFEDFPALPQKDFYDMLIIFLLYHIDDLLLRGLYKGYISKSENLGLIRGKILFEQQLLHNQTRNDKTYCTYSEITLDTMENRLIKFTLSYLLQYHFLDEKIRLDVLYYHDKFQLVSDVTSITPVAFRSINYTPLNEHYKVPLDLCEIILRDSSLDVENQGEKSSLSFLINMEFLFQDFVSNLLKEKFGERNVTLQKTEYFDLDNKLKGISDIEISHDNETIILDTKYKDIDSDPPSNHVMQVHSYSVIAKARKCILIYAGNKKITTKRYDLRENISLYTAHLNLASSSRDEFNQNCNEFLEDIAHVIRE